MYTEIHSRTSHKSWTTLPAVDNTGKKSAGGDDLPTGRNLDAIDVPFHGLGAERPATRHAVTAVVECRRLILVYLAGMNHTDTKGAVGDRQGRGLVLLETNADGHRVVAARSFAGGQATATQVRIQLGEVGDAENG